MQYEFVDDYSPFEAKIRTNDGKEMILKARVFTNDTAIEFPKLCTKYDATQNLKRKGKILDDMMILLFGGFAKTYSVLSMHCKWDIINALVKHVTGQAKETTKNPTKAEKEDSAG